MAWKLRERRLTELGMTYRQYLRSELWEKAKVRYEEAGMPASCLVCGKRPYDLHHISYQRLGRELPGDLLPLCRSHHAELHRIQRAGKTQLESIHTLIRKITGWSRKRTTEALRPFNAGKVNDAHRNPSALTPKQRFQVSLRKARIAIQKLRTLKP